MAEQPTPSAVTPPTSSDQPPPTELPLTEQPPPLAAALDDSSTAPPPPVVQSAEEDKPIAATMVAKSVVFEEDPAVEGDKKEKHSMEIPQSLISFKEERNRLDDLSDSERKALDEFKLLVHEALDTRSFTSPLPPPPSKEENQASAMPEFQKAEDQSSDVSTEVNPSAEEVAEKVEEAKAESAVPTTTVEAAGMRTRRRRAEQSFDLAE
ncbi:PATL3 [Linum grandiflorum]